MADTIEASGRAPSRARLGTLAVIGSPVAAVLIWRALARFGLSGNGAAWASAQLLLVFVACFDVATRRVPNRVVLPAALVVLALRAAFSASSLVETAAAGLAAFAIFLLIAVLTRGGVGMGDVKLAGFLGLLLGRATLPALFVGAAAGGVASAIVLIVSRGGRGRTIAYAPYLCFGAAVAVLALSPPGLA